MAVRAGSSFSDLSRDWIEVEAQSRGGRAVQAPGEGTTLCSDGSGGVWPAEQVQSGEGGSECPERWPEGSSACPVGCA